MAQWIVQAWSEIPEELVKASSVNGGIGSDVPRDGLHSSLKSLLDDGEVPDDIAEESDTDVEDSTDGSDEDGEARGIDEVPSGNGEVTSDEDRLDDLPGDEAVSDEVCTED